jgi:raffinose/stachyose/melibiose transport system permease protein
MRQRLQVALYLLPALLLVTIFFALPLAAVAVLRCTEWAGIGTPRFVGLGNFVTLFSDPAFLIAIRNAIIWILINALLHTPLYVLVALVVGRRPLGWKIFRTAPSLPNIIGGTALALLWYFIFHVSLGLLNGALSEIGLKSLTQNWLFNPRTTLGTTLTPWVLYVGFGMVLFLTQISTIPREYYEAAEIDGASISRQDLLITIPLIRRAIALQSIFVVGYALRSFEYPFIMTSGGPATPQSLCRFTFIIK